MSVLIDKKTGKVVKKVTNLGYLLNNWKKVESFTIDEHPTDVDGCILMAHFYQSSKID